MGAGTARFFTIFPEPYELEPATFLCYNKCEHYLFALRQHLLKKGYTYETENCNLRR